MLALRFALNPAGWLACLWLKHFWPGCLSSPLNGLELVKLPPPELPAGDWVRCRTLLGGICGSDLALLAQRHRPDSVLQAYSSFPAVLGHENVAVVEAVGPEVDRSWVGRRVTVDPALCCQVRGIDPPCRPCRDGQFGACENFSANGLGRSRLPPGSCLGYCGPVGGTWSEQFVAHVSQLIAPPEQLSDALAALTDPLACSLHAVLRTDLDAVERVLVAGTGTLGLGIIWALRAVGFAGQIDATCRHDHQADLAHRLGASEVLRLPRSRGRRYRAVAERIGGRAARVRLGNWVLSGGYDVVFECVGSPGAIADALKWTRSRGQTVLVGTGHGRGADLTAVWFGELTVLGSSGRAVESFRGRRVHTYRLVHDLLGGGSSPVAELLTHTFRLKHYRQAIDVALNKGAHQAIKVAFALDASATVKPDRPEP